MTKLQDFLNSSIPQVTVLARAAKAGDLYGIELECEGRHVDFGGEAAILKDWTPEHDGSLRANHGSCCEWIFNGPVKYNLSVDRINKLFDYFVERKARLVTSNRTSTHVHFNMGDKNAYQLVNMFILFSILEDLLDRYCGEDRRGNLFCLSSRHAEEQVRWMQDSCFKNFNFNFNNNNRYCSFNFASIVKFGTVEFRGMRGLDNREDLLAWLSILKEFCEYSCYKMKNPVDLVEMISEKSPTGLLKEVFSAGNVKKLTEGLDENTINHSVYEGLRLVQMLCYKIGTEFGDIRLRGKDFWAAFQADDAVIRDKEPEEILNRPARLARAPRQPFQFRVDPGMAAPEAIQEIAVGQAEARLARVRAALELPADVAAEALLDPVAPLDRLVAQEQIRRDQRRAQFAEPPVPIKRAKLVHDPFAGLGEPRWVNKALEDDD